MAKKVAVSTLNASTMDILNVIRQNASAEYQKSAIKDKFKDDTTDSTLSFIEDVSDTINDLESKASGEQNWKQKYEDNDKQWREKI